MRLLLDTQALLWWLADDNRLGPRVRALIENPANDILVSSASFWEMAVKMRVGKLEADMREVTDAVEREGFTRLDISAAHLLALLDLPIHHRDPFDHLLIAQAISEGATFVSDERHTPLYPVAFMTCLDPPSPPTSR